MLIEIFLCLLYILHTIIEYNSIFFDEPSSEIKNIPTFFFDIAYLKIKVESFTILYLDKIKIIGEIL